MTLRVLLVDDNMLIREGLRMTLEMEPDIEVVGEVADGREVLDAVGKTCPDVVCMDVNMLQMDGIKATQQVLGVHPEIKVIGLSVHASLAIVGLLFDAGATGYVIKSAAGAELSQAIRQVSEGQTYLSQGLGLTGIADLERYMRRGTRGSAAS
jgi:DNA-binding NarL/FixJ family response regulator